MKTGKRVELLAPAGSIDAFYGAIHAGADAVYLGGNRFGARAYADNFTEEELLHCIRYAHLFGRKVYLTVNTLVKESEFSDLHDYLCPYYEAGLDGVIIQDLGVLSYVREHFPHLELHVSTQMTITGRYGAALLQKKGACRIVPARELSLKELVEIKQQTGLEVEVFIHGAMCYCYSGQCLFSSILGGRSGNRGRCAQPCRLPYTVGTSSDKKTAKELYPLSLKDMCTIEHIPELIEAGIDSFKIEGRMKKPEYAAGVTAIYRKYIDAYYEKCRRVENGSLKASGKGASAGERYKALLQQEDLQLLSSLYIRSERQDGYFYKHNGRDMVTLHNPAYSGADEGMLAKIRETYIEQAPRMAISVKGSFLTGTEAFVTLTKDGLSVTAFGQTVQKAQKQPITEENVKKQLGKLGESVFRADSMEVKVSPDGFYPLKQINELRREAVLLLEKALLSQNGYEAERREEQPDRTQTAAQGVAEQTAHGMAGQAAAAVTLCTMEQLKALLASGFSAKRLSVEGDLFSEGCSEVLSLCREGIAKGQIGKVLLAQPYILRSADASYLERLYALALENEEMIGGFLVRSLEGLGFLLEKSYSGSIYTDANVYVWNREAWKELSQKPVAEDPDDRLAGFCLPYELKSAEQRPLRGLPCEKIVYGRIPMMLTANCVAKTTDKCRKVQQKNPEDTVTVLTDRYRTEFPVLLNCAHCMNIIYNSVPLSLHGELDKWQDACDLRLDFTLENGRETDAVLGYFAALMQAAVPKNREAKKAVQEPPFSKYTTGHEKRGVL